MHGISADPIACSLDAAALQRRLAAIAALNARALLGARRDDLMLELDYAPDALADVREMVALEQGCCGFFAFDIAESDDVLRLTVTAPETAREAADQLFAPFASTTVPDGALACGCVGGCGA